jgi:hypothetical protein
MQYSYPASSNPCGKSEIRSEITTDSLKWIELLGSQTRIPAAMVQMALAVGADLHRAAMAQHRMDEAQNLVVAAQNLGAAAQHLAAEVGTTQNLVMAAQNLGGWRSTWWRRRPLLRGSLPLFARHQRSLGNDAARAAGFKIG